MGGTPMHGAYPAPHGTGVATSQPAQVASSAPKQTLSATDEPPCRGRSAIAETNES